MSTTLQVGLSALGAMHLGKQVYFALNLQDLLFLGAFTTTLLIKDVHPCFKSACSD